MERIRITQTRLPFWVWGGGWFARVMNVFFLPPVLAAKHPVNPNAITQNLAGSEPHHKIMCFPMSAVAFIRFTHLPLFAPAQRSRFFPTNVFFLPSLFISLTLVRSRSRSVATGGRRCGRCGMRTTSSGSAQRKSPRLLFRPLWERGGIYTRKDRVWQAIIPAGRIHTEFNKQVDRHLHPFSVRCVGQAARKTAGHT